MDRLVPRCVLYVAIASLALVTIVLPIVAGTYTVNSTADLPDADPADGVCRTANNNCTLRAAIMQADFTVSADTIILPARTNTVTGGGVGAGGGIFAHLPSSTQLIVRDSQIYSNTADGTGGGIYVDGSSTTQWSISRSEIYSNTAASGGGIGNFVTLTLSDSGVHDNQATFDGGAMEAFAPFIISRSTLNANSAARFGG